MTLRFKEDPLRKFKIKLSRKTRAKNFRIESFAIDSKFQTLYTLTNTRKKFSSVMVYVMISPNNAAYTCQHNRHANQSKRKSSGEKEKILSLVSTEEIWR